MRVKRLVSLMYLWDEDHGIIMREGEGEGEGEGEMVKSLRHGTFSIKPSTITSSLGCYHSFARFRALI
jgi:hypothetical protein